MNRRLRSLIVPADAQGHCLLCGKSPCTCAPLPVDLIEPAQESRFLLIEFGGQVKQWAVCKGCGFLIGLTKARPAVRCPHCQTVN